MLAAGQKRFSGTRMAGYAAMPESAPMCAMMGGICNEAWKALGLRSCDTCGFSCESHFWKPLVLARCHPRP